MEKDEVMARMAKGKSQPQAQKGKPQEDVNPMRRNFPAELAAIERGLSWAPLSS